MAVVAMWKCDRDGSMFDDKKEADAYDKLLELGEQFTQLLEQAVPGVDEQAAEEFGLMLARNKQAVIQACRGRPEILAELLTETAQQPMLDDASAGKKVTALKAAK